MASQTLAPTPGQRAGRQPLFDIHPQTGATIEVFYADRTLETFGRCGAGWFWCSRRSGLPPDGPATGPFPTSYAAYRHAMNRVAAIVRGTGTGPTKLIRTQRGHGDFLEV